jgi:hypothetical protein
MKKILLASTLLLGSPAFATDYLVQQPGDSVATQLWLNAIPVPGANCPVGSFFCPFSVQNNDNRIGNYSITSGNAEVYNGPPAPPVAAKPPVGLNVAVLQNGTSGSLYWCESNTTTPGGATIKEITAAFNGYTQASTTITFPVAFTVKPSVVSAAVTGVSGVTITTTGVTFAANNVNGTVVIKGI